MFYQGDANVRFVEIQCTSSLYLTLVSPSGCYAVVELAKQKQKKKNIIHEAHYQWSLFKQSDEHNVNLLHKYAHPSACVTRTCVFCGHYVIWETGNAHRLL